MADITDLATDRELAATARALEAARRPQPAAIQPTGHCHNCGEVIEGALFCDVDCRDDWQLRQKAAR